MTILTKWQWLSTTKFQQFRIPHPVPDFGCPGPSRPLARFLACRIVHLSRYYDGTSVLLSRKVALSHPVGNTSSTQQHNKIIVCSNKTSIKLAIWLRGCQQLRAPWRIFRWSRIWLIWSEIDFWTNYKFLPMCIARDDTTLWQHCGRLIFQTGLGNLPKVESI